jgi:hypothetical protein
MPLGDRMSRELGFLSLGKKIASYSINPQIMLIHTW